MAHKPYVPRKNSAAARKRRSNVPLYLLGVAVALIALGAVVLLRQGSTGSARSIEVTGQPRLAVDREQIDFGKVPLDKPVRAEFQLSNVGDQPLQILGVPAVEVKEGC